MKSPILFFVGALLSVPAAFGFTDPLHRTYRIHADLRGFENREITAGMEMDIENRGSTPVQELRLMTYPNRFERPLPELNDLNYRRVYPNGFSRGSLSIEESSLITGEKLTLEEQSIKGLPPRTLWRIALPKPIEPNQSVTIRIRYRLKVPKKYGTFGYYRGVLTLSGGWYPYIVSYDERTGFRPNDFPPPASWKLRFQTDVPLIAGNRILTPASGIAEDDPGERREISLWMSRRMHVEQIAGRQQKIQIVLRKEQSTVISRVRELAVNWLDFLDHQPALSDGPSEIFLVQAPLREALVTEGEGITYFSDRAFKLFPTLGQYHSVPFLRGLFYQFLLPEVSRRESAADYDWVVEALAWNWTQEFTREKNFETMDARRLGLVRAFAFLPAVDEVIYAPQFAFYDVFYDFVYPYDPVRDEALHFNHPKPYGRAIFAHLEDEVGAEKAAEIAGGYLVQPDVRFEDLAALRCGKDLSENFVQWTTPRTAINYDLKRHRERKTENGYEQEVTVLRQSPAEIVEPVELRAVGGDGEIRTLVWNGAGSEHIFQFRTKTKVKILEIDPRRRLDESRLADNRHPPKYKFVLTEVILDYDFSGSRPSFSVGTQFRRSYGGSNRYNFGGFLTTDEYGFGVGYTRLFGRLIDRLRLSHAMGISYDLVRLEEDRFGFIDPATGQTQIVQTSPSIRTTSVTVSYGFGNQLSTTNPLQGGHAGLSVTWGSEALGGEADYYRTSVGGGWIWKIHPSHLLAWRALLGASGPDDIPTQVRYSLGGINAIRGLAVDDPKHQGRYIVLGSGEYRHFLIQDIDINLWLLRIRDVQGALFLDAGNATDTVYERAQILANGGGSHTTLGDLFDLPSWSSDVGYGIRFHIEYLGVDPALARFDVAKSLDDGSQRTRFYFGVTQSF
ncbi:MAG TPA: BamA/TamA family outer membrane protein [Bdellovibrionota bacterium]|nr:BamA/TamA family outer membrane protein [Bdellovibrionota bacterium]